MCVGAQTPRSLLVPKRASVCAAERERRGRAYETLAMTSRASAKRKPVLQRRASTCCSARCGGGGTAPSAGGHTRCGRAGRPRRTTAWAAAGIGGHLRGIVPPASRRNEGPSSRPRQPSASAEAAERLGFPDRVWCVDSASSSSPASQSFCPRGHCGRPPVTRSAIGTRSTKQSNQCYCTCRRRGGKRGSEDSVGRIINHLRWRDMPTQPTVVQA